MRNFFRMLFLISTIVVVLFYLFSCLTPYISPARFWPFTFIALGFPLIAFALLFFIVCWFFIKKKTSLILLVIFFLGYKNLSATWGIHFPNHFNYNKQPATLRILSWNVRYFDNNERRADSPTAVRRQMINFIKKANADVMLFQDYEDYHNPLHFSNLETIRDSLGYRFCYTSKDFKSMFSFGLTETGCAIYSKLPITDSGKLVYQNIAEPESISYADVTFQNKKIRFFTTHLISMNIRPHPGIRNEEGRQEYDSAYRYSKNIIRTLKHYDQVHVKEAEFAKNVVSKSPYPSIITGDFNSVPSSYVYHTIKGDKQDAFVQKGFGLGHSYYALSETLRIDYILVDPSFKVLQVTTPSLYLSDHFPVVTDIKWKN